MATLHRAPVPALRALVATVWAHDPSPGAPASPGAREHVLPTGATHIALRLDGPPLRIYAHAADPLGQQLGHAVVGGARTVHHLRDVSQPSASVGAMLRPGAASVLLGAPESTLAGQHTPLDQLLPASEVAALSERLRACGDGARRLALFEHWLFVRARGRPVVLHPALIQVLQRPAHPGQRVADLVRASGLSHRHCIALFRQVTGLTPGQWLALQRFNQVLGRAVQPLASWSDIAAACGYADQAHLANSFRDITGLTPSAWRRQMDPVEPRHVPQVLEPRPRPP
ncbi:AraC family transcriptional regulator [Hylemonella gracilis str. Niagara R]|uniref:AraC family transcriptional regulator n=1 Tax=Hylemonella gracilis str. Niagara R TaxID=1458275 RepID=A0A016XIM3_9BURK|nr:AraC family transcriptional regulator [Hylemonella gracilis]EYC51417.1 AraC family transcriptional regulator [Hylemonella gracilis str. Niagara R]